MTGEKHKLENYDYYTTYFDYAESLGIKHLVYYGAIHAYKSYNFGIYNQSQNDNELSARITVQGEKNYNTKYDFDTRSVNSKPTLNDPKIIANIEKTWSNGITTPNLSVLFTETNELLLELNVTKENYNPSNDIVNEADFSARSTFSLPDSDWKFFGKFFGDDGLEYIISSEYLIYIVPRVANSPVLPARLVQLNETMFSEGTLKHIASTTNTSWKRRAIAVGTDTQIKIYLQDTTSVFDDNDSRFINWDNGSSFLEVPAFSSIIAMDMLSDSSNYGWNNDMVVFGVDKCYCKRNGKTLWYRDEISN